MSNPKKILISIEDYMLANLLNHKFSRNFHSENTMVEDGKRAIKAIQNEKFDLVLTSFYLPFHAGYEIIQEVKNQQESETAVVLLSPSLSDDIILNASLMGADDFISMPYDPMEVIIRSRRLLNQ